MKSNHRKLKSLGRKGHDSGWMNVGHHSRFASMDIAKKLAGMEYPLRLFHVDFRRVDDQRFRR
jgi:hypothetical protein